MSALDRTLSALADPARRGAVDLLRTRPRRAGELAASLGLSAPAMSRHLRVLKTTGLVEEARGAEASDARVRVYRLRPEPFDALRSWVADVESFWTLELAGPPGLHAQEVHGAAARGLGERRERLVEAAHPAVFGLRSRSANHQWWPPTSTHP